jgi:hypothetical protein
VEPRKEEEEEEEYLMKNTNYEAPHIHSTSSLLGPNILLSILF